MRQWACRARWLPRHREHVDKSTTATTRGDRPGVGGGGRGEPAASQAERVLARLPGVEYKIGQ